MAQLFVSSMGLERKGRKPNCYSYSSPFPNPHQEGQTEVFIFGARVLTTYLQLGNPNKVKRLCVSDIKVILALYRKSDILLFSNYGALVTFRSDSKFCHKMSLLK